MPTDSDYASYVFQPGRHDCRTFTCGEPELDAWLRDKAADAARARVAQTFVWADEASGHGVVVAYYALSAHAIPRIEAPSRIGRGVPDPVPAALIGKLALDVRLHAQGLGEVLLVDALHRIVDASSEGPAVRAIVVDAATDAGRRLYAKFGFVAAPSRPDRMLIRTETVVRALN